MLSIKRQMKYHEEVYRFLFNHSNELEINVNGMNNVEFYSMLKQLKSIIIKYNIWDLFKLYDINKLSELINLYGYDLTTKGDPVNRYYISRISYSKNIFKVDILQILYHYFGRNLTKVISLRKMIKFCDIFKIAISKYNIACSFNERITTDTSKFIIDDYPDINIVNSCLYRLIDNLQLKSILTLSKHKIQFKLILKKSFSERTADLFK